MASAFSIQINIHVKVKQMLSVRSLKTYLSVISLTQLFYQRDSTFLKPKPMYTDTRNTLTTEITE